MSHPDPDALMRHAEGDLLAQEAEIVANHLATCQECRNRENSMRVFASGLNTHWLATRLRSSLPRDWGCPSAEEIEGYFLGDLSAEDHQRVQGHVKGCPHCQGVLGEMEREASALFQADPLATTGPASRESFWDRLRASFTLMPAPAWAVATVAVVIVFAAGLALGPVMLSPRTPLPGTEHYGLAKPPYTPSPDVPAFGIAPSVNPLAEQRFREAMAYYPEDNFPDMAIPQLKEAIAADPRYDQAQFWLGVAHLLRGQARLGITPLEAAVSLAPGKAEYKQYLVWAYLKAGETDRALRLQTQILERR